MDSNSLFIVLTLLFATLTALLGYRQYRQDKFRTTAADIIRNAEQESEAILRRTQLDLDQHRLNFQKDSDETAREGSKKLARESERLEQRENKLEERLQLFEKKLAHIEKREQQLEQSRAELADGEKRVAEAQSQLFDELQKASGWSCSEARRHFLDWIAKECKTDAANYIRRTKKEAEEEAERLASKVIATAINRLAASYVSESTVNTIPIPSDEMKGRIIGREGRNIRTLERTTGVNFIIDDTPNAVVLSCFDPVRLHIAKIALTELITDGRIHPTKIEETVAKAEASIQKQIKQFGEDAALRSGAVDLHPELLNLLGRLKFRTSYGQNVLEHSIEVSQIMGLLASELGLDSSRAMRIGLLHDIGKAVSHEIEGSHAIIGHDLALKYGETAEVSNGIGCHHQEMEPTTIEASLCSAADALSGARPGARIEAVAEYIKRLQRLEEIAQADPSVLQAYALQAGREVRVIVHPQKIDDDGTITLARNITKLIEKELRYPGKIKVTVIREHRVTEYAV